MDSVLVVNGFRSAIYSIGRVAERIAKSCLHIILSSNCINCQHGLIARCWSTDLPRIVQLEANRRFMVVHLSTEDSSQSKVSIHHWVSLSELVG